MFPMGLDISGKVGNFILNFPGLKYFCNLSERMHIRGGQSDPVVKTDSTHAGGPGSNPTAGRKK